MAAFTRSKNHGLRSEEVFNHPYGGGGKLQSHHNHAGCRSRNHSRSVPNLEEAIVAPRSGMNLLISISKAKWTMMSSTIKSIVSKKKCRHKEGKFDLDLTYINNKIIAMGYPAENVESIYRNDYKTVKEFLDKKHQNHYWVYNLCSEKDRNYDKAKFDGRVTQFPFDDHHPPDFSLIQPFCDEVKKYLDEDDKNVAVVHCKAGKGRTGVMVCCYLLFIGEHPTAEQVLRFYGDKRTTDHKGVTIPSQRRYITYYDACRQLEYKPVKLYLKDIVLDPMPTFATTGSQCYVYFEVTQRGRKDTYVSKHYLSRKGDRNVSLSVNPPLLLSEDVKFEFYTKQKFGEQLWGNSKMKFARSGEKVFHFWLNTFFVDMELEGGLAHDLTASNSIEAGRGQGHVHHASGSSEDSSTDDVPLRPHLPPPSKAASNSSNGVKFVTSEDASSNEQCCHHPLNHTEAANEVSNLIKHASISDDHLLQDRKTRQIDFPCNSHISSMGPLSTSDENTAAASTETSSSSSTVGTTAESFMEKRIRHTSMPQQRVAAASAAVPSSSSNSSSSNSSSGIAASNHLHHHLEPSLSHAEVRNFHGFHREQHRTHATITSNSAASMDSGLMESGWNSGSTNPYQAVNIPGKLLSLRLKKGQIDKAHKDKSSKTFPENFSVTLFLLKPEDQSDNLLDYSLYTPMLNQNVAETPHTTITAVANMSNNKVNPASSTTNNSSEKQFTVVPVSDADHQLKHPGHPKPRVRPLTGGSGASSSSATPSLKSVEQSSQDSEGANSESDEDMKHASGDFRMNSDSSSTENHHQQHNENNPKCNNLRLKQRATIRPQSNWV